MVHWRNFKTIRKTNKKTAEITDSFETAMVPSLNSLKSNSTYKNFTEQFYIH